jgi:hypothetical protein
MLNGIIIIIIIIIIIDFGYAPFLVFVHSATAPTRSGPPHYRGITTTLRHT